jgi:hypothetical protein
MSKKKKNRQSISDYCVIGGESESYLSRFERLTLVGGRELEKAISWFAKQLSRFNYLDQFGSLDISELKSTAQYYNRPVLRSDPGSFFQQPLEIPLVSEREVHGLIDGSILDLEFPSSYQVQYPGLAEKYESYLTNKTVHARYWKHSDGPRPTIVAIHGWTMGDQRINSLAFQPGFFYRQGLDIVLVELPFHGRRTVVDAPPLFPSTDFVITNEAMAQAISDMRELYLYLESIEVPKIGVMGMSLGAYVASLWSSLDELAFCIPIVPLVSMADLAWAIVCNDPNFPLYRAQGISKDLFEAVYFMHCPLSFVPRCPLDARMIVAGLSDAVVPPEQPRQLWQHWDSPRIHWFEGGHVAEFKKSHAFREISRFFSELGVVSTV